MAAAGITDDRAYAEAESIMMKMGRYFQIQDDYLDCFGTPEQIGKIGRDIEENKCGWLVSARFSTLSLLVCQSV